MGGHTFFNPQSAGASVKKRRAAIILAFALIMAIACAFTADAAEKGPVMYVNPPNGYNLNLRAAPSYSARIIASYKPGQEVTVLADIGAWRKVSVNFVIGYMASEYLSYDKPNAPDAAAVSVNAGGNAVKTVYVKNPQANQRLNLRSRPSLSASILGSYPNGTPITLLQRQGEWLKVSIYGVNGYVMAKYTSGDDPSGAAAVAASSPGLTDSYRVVNPNGGSYVNQRSGAGYDYGIMQQVQEGTTVRAESRSGDWVKVTVNGITGWINSAFLK